MTFRTNYSLAKEYEAVRAHEARMRGQASARREDLEQEDVTDQLVGFAEAFGAQMRAREQEQRAALGIERRRRAIADRFDDYVQAGLEPPAGPLPVSLAMMLKLGHTIEEIDGRKQLLAPASRRASK